MDTARDIATQSVLNFTLDNWIEYLTMSDALAMLIMHSRSKYTEDTRREIIKQRRALERSLDEMIGGVRAQQDTNTAHAK